MKDNNNTDLKISMLSGKHYNDKEYSRYFTVNNIKCPVPVVISTQGGDNDPNTTQLLYQSNTKMNKTSILISIYIAVLTIYAITVMI